MSDRTGGRCFAACSAPSTLLDGAAARVPVLDVDGSDDALGGRAEETAVAPLRRGAAALARDDPDESWAVVTSAAREWHYAAAGKRWRPGAAGRAQCAWGQA